MVECEPVKKPSTTFPHYMFKSDYNTKVINKGDCMLFTSDRPVKELNDFVDYVWSFYGEHDDTLYPIFGLTKKRYCRMPSNIYH